MYLSRTAAIVAIATLIASVLLNACQQAPVAETDWRTSVELARAGRYAELSNNTMSRLALVHREYLGDRTEITFGTSPDAGIRLKGDDIAPIHVRFDVSTDPARVHEVHPDWKETGGPHWKQGDSSKPEMFSFTELSGMNTFGIGR